MNSITGNDDCQSKTSTIVDNAFAVNHSAAAPVAPGESRTSGGFCMVPWAVVDARLSPHELAVYVALVRHANWRGQAWPSVETIAGVSGMGARRAREAINELVRIGFIRREYRKTPCGDDDTPLYHVLRGTVPREVGTVPREVGMALGEPGVLSQGKGGTIPREDEPEPINKNHKEPKARRNAAAVDVPIPESLNTPEFQAAWKSWETHRQQARKPLTPMARKCQLKKLAGWGPDRAVAAIYHSVSNSWQSIHERGPERTSGTANPAARPAQALQQLQPPKRKERTQ